MSCTSVHNTCLVHATLTTTYTKMHAHARTPTTTVQQRLCNVNYCRPGRIPNLHSSTASNHITFNLDCTLAKPNIQRRACWVYYPTMCSRTSPCPTLSCPFCPRKKLSKSTQARNAVVAALPHRQHLITSAVVDVYGSLLRLVTD